MHFFLRHVKNFFELITLCILFQLITLNIEAQFREKYKDQNQYNRIRGMSFVNPATGFIAFGNLIGYTEDSGHTYLEKPITLNNTNYNSYAVNLTFGFSPHGVHAFSKDSLLAYGDYGAESSILFSADRGQTWKLVSHRSFVLNQAISFTTSDMKFPGNGNIGIAINDKEILRTTDKGQTWNIVAQIPDAVESRFIRLSFPTSKDGYAVAGDLLLKTHDAGVSWVTVNLPSNSGLNFNNVSFVTGDTGYISKDSDFTIYKTVNGGTTWKKMNDETTFPIEGRDMYFTNDSTGFICSRYEYEVYKTTDNGARWEICKRDVSDQIGNFGMERLYFYNDQTGWASGMGPYLMITTNAGGMPKPKACYTIDTTNLSSANIVQLINCSKPTYQFKWYKNDVLISTSYNITYTHDIFKQQDTIKLIVSNGVDADTLVKYQAFNPYPYKPIITSFDPKSGGKETFVTIYGSGFTMVNTVKFGGVNAESFTVVNDNMITATVANGATGKVSVSDLYSTFELQEFTYFPPPTSLPPIITSITPAAGSIGTLVTINGNNFGTMPQKNIVFFGAAKAYVISSSTTQIKCEVPAGASLEPISVLVKDDNLICSSAKPFNVTFADSSNFTSRSFALVNEIKYSISNTGNLPTYSRGKDIDGDGKPDLISSVRYNERDSMLIYRNTSTLSNISFAQKNTIGGYYSQYGVSRKFDLNDLDGDGKPDVLWSTNMSFLIAIRNTSSPGSISFSNQITIPCAGSEDVVIEDFNNDGKNDIAAAATGDLSTRSGNISVIKNTGASGFLSFAEPKVFITNNNNISITAGDIDGDGKKDIVLQNSSGFSYFKNISDTNSILFAPEINFSIPNYSPGEGAGIGLYDYDNDNKLDVIVFTNYYFWIFRNTSIPGNISFESGISTELPGTAASSGNGWGGCISNLSGDMLPDILTGALTLYRNISVPGTIATDNSVGINPRFTSSMNTADFNLDGKMDIISTSPNYREILIYKNNIGIPVDIYTCARGNTRISADIGGSTYQWQKDTGSGFINLNDDAIISGSQTNELYFTKIPLSWDDYKYRCIVDGNYTSTYIIHVDGSMLPTVTLTVSDSTICYGTTVTFTAEVYHGGANPFYKWLINDVDVMNNSNKFITNKLNNNDKVKVIIFREDVCSNQISDTSDVITMNVTGSMPSVIVSASDSLICKGSPVTFTATPINEDISLSYQWKVNGINAGTNSPIFTTSSLNNEDNVKVTIRSSLSCSSTALIASDSIIVRVKEVVVPSVNISTSSTSICLGSDAIFTATFSNEGSTPVYQWQVNNITIGISSPEFSTSSLTNGSQVKLIMKSSAFCVSQPTVISNIITMNVINPTSPTVSISSALNNICMGENITLTATPVNGGSSPLYQWQVNDVNAGTNSNIFTTNTLTNGSKIKVIMTSNASCASPASATSNAITINVNSVTPAISISTSSTNICSGSNIIFTARVINGGLSPQYQWVKNGINVGLNDSIYSSNNLINGDVISVILTSNASCANPVKVTSTSITMTVNSISPTIQINGNAEVAEGSSSTLSSSVIHAGTSPSYQWQDSTSTHTWLNISSATQPTINYIPISTGDKIRCILNSNEVCASGAVFSNALTFKVNPNTSNNGDKFGIKVYPNPVNSIISFDSLKLSDQWKTLEIVSFDGRQKMFLQDITGQIKVSINVSSLSSGYYIAVFKREQGESTYIRFIKQEKFAL